MSRDNLILKLVEPKWSDGLISVLNKLNRKMPTGMALDNKSLSVNLLENVYLQGFTLADIAKALGMKLV